MTRLSLSILTGACLLYTLAATAQLSVSNLMTENKINPIGLDEAVPRLTWQLKTESRGVLQTAYEVRVAEDADNLQKGKKLTWSSGKTASAQSVMTPYGGPAVLPGKRYYWQVRVWDNLGNTSAWSAPAYWQTGLMGPAGWKATWIGPGYQEDTINQASPYFRKAFSVRKKISRATAYVTAHGMYEARINGKKVGDACLTPGWTSYNNRLQYQAYDVTPMLVQGANAVGALLGNGWYRGYIGFSGQRNFYGKDIALLLQLDIQYADGSAESIVSDGTWKSSTGAVQLSEIYNGETIDARKEKTGWDAAGYDDSGWSGVKTAGKDVSALVATENEPVRKHETFKPVAVTVTPEGDHVIDFGQNLVGWVQLRITGKAGDKLSIYHAEVLDKDGNFYTENLRAAKQQDNYILKGGGEEFFEPHFTFQGFRYIKVEGFPGELKPEHFTAVALYSDMEPTGSFRSNHALLNQLQHNIQWGQRGNFLDVPTDCPQRDERLGWTGDAQAFSRTATFNMQVHNFFAKWLKDVAADQLDNGAVPFVIPNVLGQGAVASAGWADAATIIPWNMYLAYGDKKILENQFDSMKKWVDFMSANSTDDLWNKGFHFGDWLFYRPFDDNDGRSAVTDKYLIAQCFYAHSTQLLVNAARVLGKKAEETRYGALLKRIKDAFLKEYVTPNGRLLSSTQTAYVLALNFDMLPENLRAETAQRLVDNIKAYNNHLTTGFLGTPYLCHVLTRFGHADVAYALLMQDTYPSWLYPVKMGATTIWERWDGIKPDGTFQTPGMNSYNHYAYGAIGDWMYRAIAGIDTYEDGPGYKHIRIEPHIGGGLTQAAAELKTYYGAVGSAWRLEGGKTLLDVNIPANTTARILLPVTAEGSVMESDLPLNKVSGLKVTGVKDGVLEMEAGSGTYRFSW
ncbi:MAG: family 78 glycoside hydrolase catalytic domain [Lewinellaceae bacterium]|nr:family 78 glycoside hydrolase catalytic domain [Lewinellaceae bacterium]